MTLILLLGLVDFAVWLNYLFGDRLVIVIPASLVSGAIMGRLFPSIVKLHIRVTDYLDRRFS